ncbi:MULTISPECIES: amino acid adenylation domain-containing protein [Bacillus cereus group]|uniref:amino acid adenylation domain-containing protein n=1 Tax=Bacillus cereus group TaxID=86661 RepID=UPI0022E8B1E1|nr:amino acid adenylation domain-containing protein [Bacillus cereus group sp. Bc253]MDA2157988.1 amino acid adenylation domain-containing protein [Bacillus cereus group sp. Bc253]
MGLDSKLDKNNIENFMSLTSLQEGLLFHYITDEQSSMYHEQLSLTIKGDIKLDLLQKAWKCVIENNEMLRTIFRWRGIEKPIQVVLKEHEVPINYLDFTYQIDKDKLVQEVKLKDLSNRIDITRETLRIYLCKLDKNTHEMIISNHHILYDGWSNGIILKELIEVYSCLYNGQDAKKINKTKFSQFIKYLNSINKEDEKKYWSNYLENLESKDDCFSCKEVGPYKEISYKIENNMVSKIKDFSKENKILLSSILYGAWGVLLQKLNNSNEVLFGTTVSGRTENIGSIDKMVGLFINTIPLRVKSYHKTTLIELIHALDKSLNERKDFENTSLIDIREYCGLKVNEEIFNSIVTIENYPLELNVNKENVLSVEDFSIVEQTNYNMTLEILTFDGIEFKFNFNSSSIDEFVVKKLGIYLERIIETLLNAPNIIIGKIDLLSEIERNQILCEFNNTKIDYPENKTIHELFEDQVEKTPDNIAVVFENTKLTYKELNERANSLAILLKSKGVKADSIIGIIVEKSVETIVGIMGILKAGGAYLPIDPSYPKERIEYMLKDSESRILLGGNTLVETIKFNGEFIDLFNDDLFVSYSNNLEKVNNSSDLAYVIYTSGTTGNPKGVMCEHKNVVRLVKNTNYIEYKNSDRILQTGSMVFDASTFEVWGSLLNGLELYIDKQETIIVPELLEEFVIKNKITILWLTSELFNQIAKENISLFKGLRYLLVGGDVLSPKYISLVRKQCTNLKILNGYGPTENTTFSTTYLIEKEYSSNIPIGKPIANSKAYIVNENNVLMPIGVYGELCVSGDGLTRGYVNRPELTAEKFIDNPFETGKKMYKTGDLARWLPDGNVEFSGRIDNQVKIRGFRIELGEIENRLLQCESINEAAVLVKENKEKEKYICAYVVSEKNLEELNIKSCLKDALPEYMIPTYFVQIEKMPLTINGKLDRKALPEPNLDTSLTEYEAPRNEIEETLAKIWSDVLGVEKVSINDNFFEHGGHSIRATMLMAKIHKKLNKEIPLKEIFRYPTIKELSRYIENLEEKLYSKIEKVEEKEYYEVSSAQKRMYMLQQFDKDSTAYNMPIVFELKGFINRSRIEDTFKKLVSRHEALRTSFEIYNEKIVQRVQVKYKFELVKKQNENIEDIINNFVRPFNLEKAPLFRVQLLENEEKTYLLIDMHHIISDGLSVNILTDEFIDIYNGENLEPLKLQYKDFAAWQNNFLKSEDMKKQEEYWINRFSDEIPVLNMPTDYKRPPIQSFEGDSIKFEVDEETTRKLRNLAKETGTTIHMVLLSAFNILLSKYSGQEDIIVGMPIAGRPHTDLQKILGIFVNTLAIRNEPKGSKKYIDFLKEVKENSLKAYENQSYQFETLVEKLNLRVDTSRNPLFDVMFNSINIFDKNEKKIDGFLIKSYDMKEKSSKVDFDLTLAEKLKVVDLTLIYSTNLYDKSTMEVMIKKYIDILKGIVIDKEMSIDNIILRCSERYFDDNSELDILEEQFNI